MMFKLHFGSVEAFQNDICVFADSRRLCLRNFMMLELHFG
jgi:hypothetical protein